jgi:hypothetical protein
MHAGSSHETGWNRFNYRPRQRFCMQSARALPGTCICFNSRNIVSKNETYGPQTPRLAVCGPDPVHAGCRVVAGSAEVGFSPRSCTQPDRAVVGLHGIDAILQADGPEDPETRIPDPRSSGPAVGPADQRTSGRADLRTSDQRTSGPADERSQKPRTRTQKLSSQVPPGGMLCSSL